MPPFGFFSHTPHLAKRPFKIQMQINAACRCGFLLVWFCCLD
jgi:hypothetical protein